MTRDESEHAKGTKAGPQAQRFLGFSLGSEQYAMPLPSVREVIAVPEITSIPQLPSHYLGLMNLRGQVLSVVDLRLKFGIKADRTAETAVIICEIAEQPVGLVVTSINSVLAMEESEISPRPAIQSDKPAEYIMGVAHSGKKLILLLDVSKLFNLTEQTSIKNATASLKPV